MADKKPPIQDGPAEPVIDELGYAGPWGDAKPGDVAPGISPDAAQRLRDLAAFEERERQRDIIGDQIAEISEKLGEAWDEGNEELAARLIEEQHRLTQLRLSIG